MRTRIWACPPPGQLPRLGPGRDYDRLLHALHREGLLLGRDRRLGREGLAGGGEGRRRLRRPSSVAHDAERERRPAAREETTARVEPGGGGGACVGAWRARAKRAVRLSLSYNAAGAAAHATPAPTDRL